MPQRKLIERVKHPAGIRCSFRLNPDTTAKQALEMLKPYKTKRCRKYIVSTLVNSLANDNPEVIKPKASGRRPGDLLDSTGVLAPTDTPATKALH